MKSTGIFTIHSFPIKFDKYNEPIYLIPFGDVHRFAPLHAEERWLETLEWAKTKKRCYFLGMGDYCDIASASERVAFKTSKLHDSTVDTLDEHFRSNNYKFSKEISFMRGRIVGMIEGNHYWEYPSGMTTTQELCNILDCKYLGTSSFIRLRFSSSTKHVGKHSIDIIAHHGRGTSRIAGGDMRAVEQLCDMSECDIALMGDNHQKGLDYKERLTLRSGQGLTLHHRKILLARTGSFLKGWEPERKSYVVDAAFSPTDLGLIKIELTPKRDCSGDDDSTTIDIHASI
jgi:hypothetical protein